MSRAVGSEPLVPIGKPGHSGGTGVTMKMEW